MKLSETFDKILPSLHKARSQFVKVKKDKQNNHLKNKYATLDSVLDTITPALTENHLMIMQDAQKVENSIRVETTVLHISGQWAKFYFDIPIVKNDPQGVGSAFTYGRRYALAAAFGLSQADDDAQIAVKSAQDWKRDLDKCETIEDLQKVITAAWKASDPSNKVIIKEHFEKRKAELEMNNARGFNPAKPAENIAKKENVESEPKQEVKSKPITDF